MKMLFIGNDKNVYNLFRLVINTSFGIDVFNSPTTKEAIENFEGQNYEVIIFLLPQDEPEALFNFLKEKDLKIPMLFTTDNNTLSDCHQYIGNHPLTARVSYESNERVITGAVRRLLNIYGRFKKANEGFCPLPVYFFKAMPKFETDIYIKTDEQKFDRLYTKGETLKSDRLRFLREKGITHFYLKQSAYLEISNTFVNAVRKRIKPTEMRAEHLNMVSNFAIDSIGRLVPELGLKNEIVEMASVALKNMNEVMGRNIEVKELMDNILKGEGYKSEHTLFLSYLCCGILAETEWNSRVSRQKITMATFFHDMFLDEYATDLALSENVQESNVAKSALTKYLNHPAQAVDFLDKLSNVPPDVCKIILEHHERPDGTGFPHGRTWKKIFPLTAIFIVAEDFVNCVYSGGKNLDFMHDILDDMDKKYTQGNFKTIMQALRISLALPQLPTNLDDNDETPLEKGA